VSFRRRTIVAIATTTLLTLGGSFVGVALAFRRTLDRDLDLALHLEAHEEAREAALLGGNKLALPQVSALTANDVGPLAQYAGIYDPNGSLLAHTPSFACREPMVDVTKRTLNEPFDLACNGVRLRAIAVGVPQHPGSILLLAGKRGEFEADVRMLARTMFVVFVIAVAWTLFASRAVSLPIIRNQEAIGLVVRRVAAGDLSARVNASSSDREMLRLGADIDEMIARLGGLVDAQRRFVAHAAHELRSPLTTLYGELQQALRKPRTAEDYRAAIEESLSSAQALVRLADDLLALARVGAASVGESVQCSLLEIVESALASVSGRRAAAGVGVEIVGGEHVIEGRPLELQRMVRNLLENAIAHSPKGSEVRVELNAQVDRAGLPESIVTIAVADEGTGVDPADAPHIFEPFWRSAADRAHGTDGAGLGLSIAREIARAHEGELALVDSARGARFVASLPIRRGLVDPISVR
jgi:two-component system, OmpR family, sensor kinase